MVSSRLLSLCIYVFGIALTSVAQPSCRSLVSSVVKALINIAVWIVW